MQINSVGLSVPKGFLVSLLPESFLRLAILLNIFVKYYGCILCNECFVVPLAGAPSYNHTLNNPSVAALEGRI